MAAKPFTPVKIPTTVNKATKNEWMNSMNQPSKPRPPSVKLPKTIKVDMVAKSDEDSKKSTTTYGDIADAFNFDDAITWSEKFDQKPQPEMSRDEYIDLEFE